MASIKATLDSFVNIFSKADDKFKIKTLTKESLTAQLEANKLQLNVVSSSVLTMSMPKLQASYDKMLDILKTDSKVSKIVGRDAVKTLRLLPRALNPKAMAGKGVFGAMDNSYRIMTRLNVDLLDNVDKIITKKDYVIIKDTRITQAIVLGVLEASRIYARFNSYLVATMAHINSGSPEKLPKYMLKYMSKNADVYIKLVNQVTTGTGIYTVINDITNVKNNAVDVPIFDGTASVQSRLIGNVLGVESIFLSILDLSLEAIVWVGEIYVDRRHEHYADLADQKKWIENHVAILELDLANMDPNDPEYVKHKKTADYYNDKVASIDFELDKYYRG